MNRNYGVDVMTLDLARILKEQQLGILDRFLIFRLIGAVHNPARSAERIALTKPSVI